MTRKIEFPVSSSDKPKRWRLVMRLITMILLFGTIQLSAVNTFPDNDQQRTVTGRITDEGGNGLVGVNVVEKGTTNGAISNVDGGYTLTLTTANPVLVFSFVGYTTAEEIVGTRTTVDVVLQESISALEEIVVVGYTTQVRRNLSGSISTVQADQLKMRQEPAALASLQGIASGVTVSTANRPGGDAIVRIRGIGTINDPEPLYVIDGVPSGVGNNLSSSDIESITILKDAASAAIYGARGANGVVLVTTKRGRLGQQPLIEFSARTGIHMDANQYDLLNTREYAEAVWLSYKNRGVAPNHAQYGSGTTPVIPDYILPAGKMEGDP
ncbi:MAG: TonB-dependent receptor plug domain-containing protein, partial [Bacteroidales bacterium]|nr:TonB-dependent receptor plug domain-containing protein [Bacteroidales bacterium]